MFYGLGMALNSHSKERKNMGYCTRYDLDIIGHNLTDFEFHEYYNRVEEDLLKTLEEMNILDYAFNTSFESCDEVKWYEHEEDMREISKKFDSLVFILSGEGEDNFDSWRKYFLNGKMQECRARITYDSYDEKKLM